jgi:hypothetical protein
LLPSCFATSTATGTGERPRQTLQISLNPEEARLTGRSQWEWETPVAGDFEMTLTPAAQIDGVSVNGSPSNYRFSNGRLRIPSGVDPAEMLEVRYEAVFDDPAPTRPVNMDNPGHGVSGTISPRGTLLLGGAGWYPMMSGPSPRYRVEVDAPEGILAVTAGDLVEHRAAAGRTRTVWEVETPVAALALSAGRYEIRERKSGSVRVMTFFRPETRDLSDAYLEASARHIDRYRQLFGPYPFAKFAVVENFFPTGYGFPSYTLLGGRVLRLPFILDTSLGHEIAHCWWGNGVTVDVSGGNWSEGLTTYVADYRYKEEDSAEAAREYRLKMVRGYAALVPPDGGFPLSAFRSRVDRMSQAVGYHKGAMVFHMLRRRVGEDRFWETLRDLYREHRFESISWDEIQAAFEAGHDESLAAFFDGWVRENGAPLISLDRVRAELADGRWRVAGRLTQTGPGWDLRVPVEIETATGRIRETVPLTGERADFEISLPERPRRLSVDPDADVMRRLHPAEVPPTVNRLKGADRVLVVVPANASPGLRKTAELLVRSLGLRRYRVLSETAVDETRLSDASVLTVGRPTRPELIPSLPESVALTPDGVELNGNGYAVGPNAFFGVFPHPADAGRVMALFLADPAGDPTAARKITHYGTYSYLAFHEGENRAKGTWPVTHSPLIQSF